MENVFNEFKRNNISIPFNQMEVRERKDEVVMPVIGSGLGERQEKVRNTKKKRIDLENDNLLKVFAKHSKDKKVDKKAEDGEPKTA